MSTPPIYTIAPLERVDEETIVALRSLVAQLTNQTLAPSRLSNNVNTILADPRSVLFVARNTQEEIASRFNPWG